ncbi:MAG: hypothetical protein WD176_09575, partial [Pirellulales bacterium]
MQRIGVDGSDSGESSGETRDAAAAGTKDNELLDGDGASSSRAGQLWQKLFGPRRGPHTPGLWVLYFSLAALPLFG